MPTKILPFGSVEGQEVFLYELENNHGQRIQVTNYGAILVRVEVPDRTGKLENVNLGYSNLDGYLKRHPYFGATVGRFCNRIAGAAFELDGKTYSLAKNHGTHHLHGGLIGFDKLIWSAEPFESETESGVRFSVESPDGQEGYPGTVNVTVEYRWDDQQELSIEFQATTDAPTVLNLTNHSYWNLTGADAGSIRDHELKLYCDRSLDIDAELIPTGEFLSTSGTSLDFSEFRKLGERLDEFETTKGYDHCYVVNGEAGSEPRLAGVARDKVSGRMMEVWTTQPGIQLYTGNHLEDEFQPHTGFCLETQHYPDSPNQPSFPTTRLNPGETFNQRTVHKFAVMEPGAE